MMILMSNNSLLSVGNGNSETDGVVQTNSATWNTVTNKLDASSYHELTPGENIDIQNYVISSKDWTNEISSTSAILSGAIDYVSAHGGGGGSVTGDYVPLSAKGVSIGSQYVGPGSGWYFAQGENNEITDGGANFAQGSGNIAKVCSFAQGVNNSADYTSVAIGDSNSAYYDSFAQGYKCLAYVGSVAQGVRCYASGSSIAQGIDCTAFGNYSQAFGYGTQAGESTMAIGTYNKTTADAAFVIGNGFAGPNNRKDLFAVMTAGNVVFPNENKSINLKQPASGYMIGGTFSASAPSADVFRKIDTRIGLGISGERVWGYDDYEEEAYLFKTVPSIYLNAKKESAPSDDFRTYTDITDQHIIIGDNNPISLYPEYNFYESNCSSVKITKDYTTFISTAKREIQFDYDNVKHDTDGVKTSATWEQIISAGQKFLEVWNWITANSGRL